MRSFTREDLATLLNPFKGPCVSLCLPTHRRMPEAEQDRIRYRNLVREAAAKLEEHSGKRGDGVKEIIDRLSSLDGETGAPDGFWEHQREGLAVFASPEHFSHHRVPIELREIAVVSDSFHVKPLLPLLLDETRFNVLAIRKDDVTVWEGGRDEIRQVSAEGVPRTFEDAVGHAWDDSHDRVNFHGTRRGTAAAGAAGTHFHGHGGSQRSAEGDVLRFLRVVDEAVGEKVSKRTQLPLILCAVEERHAPFREISSNPFLHSEGIRKDPGSMTSEELRATAWEVLEPMRRQRLDRALDEVGRGLGNGTGSADLAEIARAIVEGRVKTLVIAERRRVWGTVDRTTGEVAFTDESEPGAADLIDDLAEMALARGGDVVACPADRAPNDADVAAAFRY